MRIARGDRLVTRNRTCYEVVNVRPISIFGDDQSRLVELRSLRSGRRMFRHKWMLDRYWQLLPRFPAMLRLPVGA